MMSRQIADSETTNLRAETLRAFAESYGVSYDSVFRAMQSGNLRVIRIGRKILVPREECERVAREGLQIRRGRPPKAKAEAGVPDGKGASETTTGGRATIE